jgi:hypothetical protein
VDITIAILASAKYWGQTLILFILTLESSKLLLILSIIHVSDWEVTCLLAAKAIRHSRRKEKASKTEKVDLACG